MALSDQKELVADAQMLASKFSTVLLATCSVDAEPEISYSPYVVIDKKLYIFLSELALHTGNLKTNPYASLLFIENECDAKNLHARKRVTYKARAQVISRDSAEWKNTLAVMESRFGEIMPLLSSLPDFHLFALTTSDANLVRGFADAHSISCDGF